jgi:hypothetical protein
VAARGADALAPVGAEYARVAAALRELSDE